MSRVYTQINLKKIVEDYFDRGYTPEGIDQDNRPFPKEFSNYEL